MNEEPEDRKTTLLRAALEIIRKCNDGIYVKNFLEETAFYDGTDCDGYCLGEDIAYELGEDGL
jgi:hypothetical protein